MSNEPNIEEYIIKNLPDAKIKDSKTSALGYQIYAGNFYAFVTKSYRGDLTVSCMKLRGLFGKQVKLSKHDFIIDKYDEIQDLIINTVKKHLQRQHDIKESKRRKFIRSAINE